jgi:hypothetical protein
MLYERPASAGLCQGLKYCKSAASILDNVASLPKPEHSVFWGYFRTLPSITSGKRIACSHDLQGCFQVPVWAHPTGWREKHSVVQGTDSFAAPTQIPAFSYLPKVVKEAF